MKDNIIVLCPSRGRPESARAVLDSFYATRALPDTELRIVVDKDDPSMGGYDMYEATVIEPQGKGMGLALNRAFKDVVPYYGIYGFIGDDHRFRTKGWDEKIAEALETPGIAYAFDGVRPDLPTQWFVSAPIAEALGWLSLPECAHFYLDDAWRELGNAAGCLRYLPDVLIEHLHYSYNKSPIDDTYKRSIEIWVGGLDRVPYEEWRNGQGFITDLETVKGAL